MVHLKIYNKNYIWLSFLPCFYRKNFKSILTYFYEIQCLEKHIIKEYQYDCLHELEFHCLYSVL